MGRGREGLDEAVGPLAPPRRAEGLGGESQDPEEGGPRGSDFQQGLVAATGPDNHVPVFLQDDVGAVIKVEDRDGVELSRGAAGLGYRLRVDKVDLQHRRR